MAPVVVAGIVAATVVVVATVVVAGAAIVVVVLVVVGAAVVVAGPIVVGAAVAVGVDEPASTEGATAGVGARRTVHVRACVQKS